MKTLVTGATGIIGQALLKQLEGEVWAIHRSPKDILGDGDIHWIRCDLVDSTFGGYGLHTLPDYEFKDLPEFDLIIHSAGSAAPQIFMANPAETIALNTTVTDGLFRHLAKGGTFVYISSVAIHQADDTAHPRAAYIEGKRCGEAICHAHRRKGKRVHIIRPSMVYGPGWKPNDPRVMFQFIEAGLKGKIAMRDHGEAVRRWLYADDAARMIRAIAECSSLQHTWEIGGNSPIRISTLAKDIAAKAGACVELPEDSDAVDGAAYVEAADMSQYVSAFGYPTLTTLEEGLDRCIKWRKTC